MKQDKRKYSDTNKLAKVKRYSIKKKYLTDDELIEIKSRVEFNVKQKRDLSHVREIDEEQVESRFLGENTNLSDADPDNKISIDKSNEKENVVNENITEGEYETIKFKEDYAGEIRTIKGEIIDELMEVKVKVTDMSTREQLMNIKNKDKFKGTIYVGNFALRETCNVTKPNLSELNQLIYAAAKGSSD